MNKSVLCLALVAAFTQPARAAFYVDDDAPNSATALAATTPPVIATATVDSQSAPNSPYLTFNVPFYVTFKSLGPKGKATLHKYFDELQSADDISLVSYASQPANFILQRMRNETIRDWLISNGVPASRIRATESAEIRPNTVAIALSRKVHVQHTTLASQFANARLVTNVTPTVLPAPAPPTPQATTNKALFNDQVKLALVQRIISLSQNKLVKAEDAITMLADILKNDQATPHAPATVKPQIAQAVTDDMPRQWILDSKKTLKDNILEWAGIAQWQPPNWIPTGIYQVSYSSTLNGTFLDALSQVAQAVPSLDFNVNKSKRTLTITENRKP